MVRMSSLLHLMFLYFIRIFEKYIRICLVYIFTLLQLLKDLFSVSLENSVYMLINFLVLAILKVFNFGSIEKPFYIYCDPYLLIYFCHPFPNYAKFLGKGILIFLLFFLSNMLIRFIEFSFQHLYA